MLICAVKNCYSSEQFAQHVADKQMKENKVTLRVYKCNLCTGYHLTHYSIAQFEQRMQALENTWADMLKG